MLFRVSSTGGFFLQKTILHIGFKTPHIKIPHETRKLESYVFLAFHRWVPVAPVGTSELAEFFKELNVPTMLVYGKKDTGLGHR
jgi:hypothetical protein